MISVAEVLIALASLIVEAIVLRPSDLYRKKQGVKLGFTISSAALNRHPSDPDSLLQETKQQGACHAEEVGQSLEINKSLTASAN